MENAMFNAAQDYKNVLVHGLGAWPMAESEATQIRRVCMCQNAKRRDSAKEFPHRCGVLLGEVGHYTVDTERRITFYLKGYTPIYRPGLYTVQISFFTYLSQEHWHELFGSDEHYIWVPNPWYRAAA